MDWLSTLEWGDVPTWISSLGGVGALIAATLAARASLAVLKIETERDKDADERAQRAQAELVAAWLVRDTVYEDQWHVCVANESKVPIYDVEVVVASVIFPDSVEHTLSEDSPVIPPGRTLVPFPGVPMHVPDDVNRLSENDDPAPVRIDLSIMNSDFGVGLLHKVSFTFSDAAGVTWERSRLGALNRVRSDESNVRVSDLF